MNYGHDKIFRFAWKISTKYLQNTILEYQKNGINKNVTACVEKISIEAKSFPICLKGIFEAFNYKIYLKYCSKYETCKLSITKIAFIHIFFKFFELKCKRPRFWAILNPICRILKSEIYISVLKLNTALFLMEKNVEW